MPMLRTLDLLVQFFETGQYFDRRIVQLIGLIERSTKVATGKMLQRPLAMAVDPLMRFGETAKRRQSKNSIVFEIVVPLSETTMVMIRKSGADNMANTGKCVQNSFLETYVI